MFFHYAQGHLLPTNLRSCFGQSSKIRSLGLCLFHFDTKDIQWLAGGPVVTGHTFIYVD